MLTCSFTGHRPHRLGLPQDEQSPPILALKAEMEKKIDELIGSGVKRFISGMSPAVDIWGAEIVLERIASNNDLVLEVAIPIKDFTDEWKPIERYMYEARYHAIVNTIGVNGGYRPAPKRSDKFDSDSQRSKYLARCYSQRNLYLARNCHYLLAVWNQSPRSGTAQTVRMARELGKIVLDIDPRYFI